MTAVLTLAMGIGTNTAIFAVINSVVLQPLPVPNPDRLVNIYRTSSGPANNLRMSYPDFVDLRNRDDLFDDVLALLPFRAALSGEGAAEVVSCEAVSASYFSTLALMPVLGRGFTNEEERRKSSVAVISHRLWAQRFHADPGICGRTLRISAYPYTVVGVMPAIFRGLHLRSLLPTDVWLPIGGLPPLAGVEVGTADREQPRLNVKGRLRPGVSYVAAGNALSVVSAQLEKAYPSRRLPRQFAVRPTESVHVSERVDDVAIPVAQGSLALAALVLLLACTNIANLVLARTMGRRAEMAVRIALGATRFRIVRLVLTENLILALSGGILGVGVFHAILLSVPWFELQAVRGSALQIDVPFDARTFAFNALVTILAGLTVSAGPALRAATPQVTRTLSGTGLTGGRALNVGVRRLLVAAQVAACVVLLTLAGLFLRSYVRAGGADLGFDPAQTAFVGVELSLHNLDEEHGRRFFERLLEGAKSLPGFVVAGLTDDLPFPGQIVAANTVRVGRDVVPEGSSRGGMGRYGADLAKYAAVTPGYFDAMRLLFVRGHGFSELDATGTQMVTVLSESAARRVFQDEDPVGRRFSVSTADGPFDLQVVGVVRDTGQVRSQRGPVAQAPLFYVPFAQRYASNAYLVVRTAASARDLVEPMKALVRQINPEVAVIECNTMRGHLETRSFVLRVGASLTTGLGICGLLLAVLGVYGLTAYLAERRTQEVGIRIALGASQRDVVRMILGEGLSVVAAGLAPGLLLAFWAGQLVSGMLYGVSGHDPLTFALVVGILLVVGLTACFRPARRMGRLSPAKALRHV